jgi:hypothetical protein
LLFGFTSRCLVHWLTEPSLFAGIWAESLSRALFAPRGTLGYVYEKIPSLLGATLLVMAIVYLVRTQPRPAEVRVLNGA